MTGRSYRQELQLALKVTALASRVALKYFRNQPRVTMKRDRSPVTQADLACERVMMQAIAKMYPADGFLTEETGVLNHGAERRWIIDPIDGTRGFIRGTPFWGSLLALEERGKVVVGVMALPAFGETFWASRGAGAFLNGRRCRVSNVSALKHAALVVGEVDALLHSPFARPFRALSALTWNVRNYGDCYGCSVLLRGWADIWIEPKLALWDFAALKILVEEAGGRFTDLNGHDRLERGSTLAANAGLHRRVLQLFKKGG